MLCRTALLLSTSLLVTAFGADRVTTANGVVEGMGAQQAGVRIFRGIPFAQPPVGPLRWQTPQPPADWSGVRKAVQFGPSCMQHPIFDDMIFRGNGKSEDCLYLNVWTPARAAGAKLPVLVYFYGGGFVAGDGSEPRYDGESMAARGMVAVTLNYRLGVFGFLAHPELSRESPHHASGNYGLLDQTAALLWVQRNIAAFGGDPQRVTIAGESAGSIAVSAQMASPLAKNLFHGAIGESGSLLGGIGGAESLADAEQEGLKFARIIGASSLAALRAMTTAQVYEAMGKFGAGRIPLIVDGYFLTEPAAAVFAAGRQARVPLLVGWNSEESNGRAIIGEAEPSVENYQAAVRKLYGDRAGEVLRLYAAATPDQVMGAATALAGDRFLGFSTWKWFDLHRKTSGQPVYRYFYAHPRPPMTAAMGDTQPGLAGGVTKGRPAKVAPPPRGAVHSAEIEYALGNLASNKVFAWTAADHQVSKFMQAYFANFIKTGNPNGRGLPEWPAVTAGSTVKAMRLDVTPAAETEQHADRYEFLDRR